MGPQGDQPTKSDGGLGPEESPPPSRDAREHDSFFDIANVVTHLEAGQIIDNQFEVVRPIGHGGMGVVYEVFDHLTRQNLALKVMMPTVLTHRKATQRFIEEVRIARRLRHPNIVAAYDVRQAGPLLFFTMELLHGKSLRRILDRHRQISLGQTAGVVHRVCQALEHAHRITVHRDVSPENVMILEDGTLRLLDFGIAQAIDITALTPRMTPMGKLLYMAPEQRCGDPDIDARADLYSLGVIFFEMLTGEIPHSENRLLALRPDLPRQCEELVTRALAPREERFQSARELRKAVRAAFQAYEEALQGRPPTPPPVPRAAMPSEAQDLCTPSMSDETPTPLPLEDSDTFF